MIDNSENVCYKFPRVLLFFATNSPKFFERKMQDGAREDAKAASVLWFPCRELTCCCTQHEPNVGMTMRLSQLLFFQVQSCCPPPPPPPPVLLSPDAPLVVTTVFMAEGDHRSSHSNAPASSSLRGTDTVFL